MLMICKYVHIQNVGMLEKGEHEVITDGMLLAPWLMLMVNG